eukprot:GHVQ01024348.1.p1 GENE.GHVQ01024348.1~~GHVQ01024348.1.p1  ORF type:complete len:160 (+),score=17.35 GHVQ01024348.1:154-633(+)
MTASASSTTKHSNTPPTVQGRQRREASIVKKAAGLRTTNIHRKLTGGFLAYLIQFAFCVTPLVFHVWAGTIGTTGVTHDAEGTGVTELSGAVYNTSDPVKPAAAGLSCWFLLGGWCSAVSAAITVIIIILIIMFFCWLCRNGRRWCYYNCRCCYRGRGY